MAHTEEARQDHAMSVDVEHKDKEMAVFTYYAVIFSGLLVIANVLAVKPVAIFGTVVPAAVITYAITFAITDTVNEIWGAKRSAQLVSAGFVVSIVVAVFIRIAIWMPAADGWEGIQAFADMLGGNIRIVIASMIAYLVSQFHDVWAFSYWRKVTSGKHLWLRNNASTIVSQFIDSTLFITVAFYGVWGGMDIILPAIIGQFTVKIVIALVDTPFVYGMVWWTKRKLK